MRGYQRIGFTFQTFFVASGHPHECLCVPLGSLPQAFSVGIFAQTFEDGADRAGEALFPFELFSRGGIQSEEGGLCWEVNEEMNERADAVGQNSAAPGHPRPFGSGIGLSTPVAGGEESPEFALVDCPTGLRESIIFSIRFGGWNSFMTSLSLAPRSWAGTIFGARPDSCRFSRLAERRVECDLESKLWRAMVGNRQRRPGCF